MVEDLDAIVAYGAVAAPRRSVELARDAPFHANGDSVDLNVPIKDANIII